MKASLFALAALVACVSSVSSGCKREAAPRGEALLIVDTDLPVPRIVNRLRVDLYTADRKTWYVSREIPTLDSSAWPVSFSVFDPDEAAPRTVVVRLRAYQAGVVRDYHGERYTPRPPSGKPGEPAPIAPTPIGETPRLLADDGADITPPNEPEPWVTVDRLVRIPLVPGVRGSVRVVLRGACAGTMADLEQGTTCIDANEMAASLADAALDPDMSRPTSTRAGTFGAPVACTAETRSATMLPDGSSLFDDEACVPGGIFIFGSADAFGRGERSDVPQRVAVMPPFRMDKNEVTVGRWRDAVAHGFVPPIQPAVNIGVLDPSVTSSLKACTWSTQPMGRESMPLNCVQWTAAQAFCKFAGGDLPTEVEWEFVAMDAGRPVKTRYPWGDEEPTCTRAVYARQVNASSVFHATDCNKIGKGPAPVDAVAGDGGDVAIGTGVVNLAGNVSEAIRDAFASLDSSCWAAQTIDAPACFDDTATHHSLRGGSWAENAASMTSDFRDDLPGNVESPLLGFRCVREIQ